MLEVKKVSISYTDKNILSNISFFAQDNFIILGDNAQGKSTLAKALCNLIEYEGEINIYGQNLKKLSHHKRAKLINYVPPTLESYEKYISLKEFIELGCLDKKCQSLDILKEFDMLDKQAKNISNMSSGQKQLCLIMQALLQDSKITIFDEPIANLDIKRSKFIFNLFKQNRFNKQIIITHDLNFAYQLGFDILYLKNKKILFFGKNKEFFSPKNVYKIFQNNILVENDKVFIKYD